METLTHRVGDRTGSHPGGRAGPVPVSARRACDWGGHAASSTVRASCSVNRLGPGDGGGQQGPCLRAQGVMGTGDAQKRRGVLQGVLGVLPKWPAVRRSRTSHELPGGLQRRRGPLVLIPSCSLNLRGRRPGSPSFRPQAVGTAQSIHRSRRAGRAALDTWVASM